MKKIITILLALALCVAVFAACGEGASEGANENKTPEKTTLTVVINNGIKETKGEYNKGDVIEAPKDPIRNGYIFEGWFVGETQITFPYTVNEAVTITAKMTAEPAVPVELEEEPEDMEISVGERTKGPMLTQLMAGDIIVCKEGSVYNVYMFVGQNKEMSLNKGEVGVLDLMKTRDALFSTIGHDQFVVIRPSMAY